MIGAAPLLVTEFPGRVVGAARRHAHGSRPCGVPRHESADDQAKDAKQCSHDFLLQPLRVLANEFDPTWISPRPPGGPQDGGSRSRIQCRAQGRRFRAGFGGGPFGPRFARQRPLQSASALEPMPVAYQVPMATTTLRNAMRSRRRGGGPPAPPCARSAGRPTGPGVAPPAAGSAGSSSRRRMAGIGGGSEPRPPVPYKQPSGLPGPDSRSPRAAESP